MSTIAALRTWCMSTIFATALSSLSTAQDWPQFNGPHRNGVLDPVFQLSEFPQAGLTKVWSAPISGGYSGVAVRDGKVIVTDFVLESGTIQNNPGARDAVSGVERVLCLDAQSGKLLWEHKESRTVSVSFAAGPRATPTIDTEMVYTLGSEGDLLALDLKTGSVRWKLAIKERYHVEAPLWGFAASPLLDGDRLITLAGGEGSLIVALNKATGEEIWRSGSSEAIGYCPPTILGDGQDRQILVWDSTKLNGFDPETGKLLWSEPLKPQYEMSIAPPLQFQDMLYVSGIGEVAAMYKVKPNRTGLEKLWSENDRKSAVYLSNAAGVFREGIIAGADCGSGKFIAINPQDGKRYWETMKPTSNTERRASHGTAFVFSASNGYDYLFSETGDLILAKLTPEGYQEVSRQHLLEPTNFWQDRQVVWSYPAFASGCIFVRNDKELVCFDLTP